MTDRDARGPACPPHRVGDRVAWASAEDRTAGEGVVSETLPPTAADGQSRYAVAVFREGCATGARVVLPHGVLYPIPTWERAMQRDERLRHHGGSTLPWNEPIPGP